MTSYEDIYSSFLGRIEDLSLANMSESDRNERLFEYFKSAMAYIEADRIKLVNDLSNRDDEIEEFNIDLENYEMEIIAIYMTVAWYTSKLNAIENTTLFIGHKEEKWTSVKEMANVIRQNRKEAYNRARKLCRDYGYVENDYLEGY